MGKHSSTSVQVFFWIAILAGLLLYAPGAVSLSTDDPSGDLIINEFVAANRTGLTDEDGDYSDWIELYNRGSQAVNLAGWSLTDDPAQPAKWTLPEITLGSQEYLLVFASGKDRKSTASGQELHANFKLNREREFLGLYNIFDDRFVDVVAAPSSPRSASELGASFPEQVDDVAFGRYRGDMANGQNERVYGYMRPPTPGQPNGDQPLWVGLIAPVEFSQERGFYETPLTVTLSTATPGATIRFTTDGSEPNETNGIPFTGPITIDGITLLRAAAFKPGFRPSPVETHTYIFEEDVLTQSETPPGFPGIWGGYKGSPVMADYQMDPEIVNDPRYSRGIADALKSIPTISIVTEPQSFHDLYANPRRRGKAWERPASIELIDPEHAEPGFQVNAGLRIHGELGRSEYMPKHSFRLFFRREYGAGKLEYPFFSDSPVKEFNTLILRSGVNRSFAGFPDRESEVKRTTYTRDEWLRASQIAMTGHGAHGRFVHLYLNGLYWGLYNGVERLDHSFMTSYYGGQEEEWDVISHEETLSHTSERFGALHNLAQAGQLDDPETYARLTAYLDITHFIDYLILNWYAGNLDWAFNNWTVALHNPAGQARYFVWDGERIWIDGAEIFMDMDEYLDHPNLVTPLFEALLENPDFRMALADRIYKHLFNEGVLTEANAKMRWMALNSVVEPAIIAESARWGDTRQEPPLTQADWLASRDDVLAQMSGNVTNFIDLVRDAGYYPDIDPPLFSQPGGPIPRNTALTMTLPFSTSGTIYYTTDGSDPRMPVTGEVAPQAKIYDDPLIFTTPTPVKARVLAGDTWSALAEAIFSVSATARN